MDGRDIHGRDQDGNLRDWSGAFVGPGATGTPTEQIRAGVTEFDNLFTANLKVGVARARETGIPYEVGPIPGAKWVVVGVALCVVAILAYAGVQAMLMFKGQGIKARGELLSWAAGSDLGALVDLKRGLEAAIGKRASSVRAMDPAALAATLQQRTIAQVSATQRPASSQEEDELLGAAALKCLSDDAAGCLRQVAQRSPALDQVAMDRSLASGTRWMSRYSAIPTMLSAASAFVEFELMKARGPKRGDIDEDKATATLLALCMRMSVYDEAVTPQGCAQRTRTYLERDAGKPRPITRERLALLDGLRWKAANLVYASQAKGG